MSDPYCERLCGKIENFQSASCILVKNSSRASNMASVAFDGEAGIGSLIEAQKIWGRSGVRKSCATNALENDRGQKKEWPGLNEISPSQGSSSSSCSCMNLLRCLPSSSFSSISMWLDPFNGGELLSVSTSCNLLSYRSPSGFVLAAAMVASDDMV